MSYAESISKFMAWAEEKIAQAVAEDEAFEAKAGTRDILTEKHTLQGKKLTNEQKIMIVLQVQQYRREGNSASKSCEMAGCSPSAYNTWAKKFKLPYTKSPSL